MNFVYVFGAPVTCSPESIGFRGFGFTVVLPYAASSIAKVMQVQVVTSGESWNPVDEKRICEGFWPPNPNLKKTTEAGSVYSTDEGDILYEPGLSGCLVKFTGA